LKEMEEMDVADAWFQQDGATTHTAWRSMQVLREMFLGKVRGDVRWPAHSPDLAPCDFFFWGYLKSKVYTHRPENLQALKDAIRRDIAAIPPAINEIFMRAFKNRLEECIANDGHHLGDIILNPLNAELNPICHLPALLGGATIVVVSSLRVKT
jgi:hypothetical protein